MNTEGMYGIDLEESYVQVFPMNEKTKPEKGFGYVHDGYVYIYRGKKKKTLKPASFYKNDDGTYIWVKPSEDEKEIYSAERITPMSNPQIVEEIENKANLKEVDFKLIESADDAFLPTIHENDDPLKKMVKEILNHMRVEIKPNKIPELKNEISNMKSNLVKPSSKLSIAYFLKWIHVLNLDVTITAKFTNSDGEMDIISTKLE